ncbi:hypothetical protein Golob_013642 [Gossypium lobatum]|uniref:Non-haem dioxygenase N-terminal domain-containing protein n=3 Tax=Gossypium TaxID=3633 RepID=A0A7J8LQ39_9ROSI|nr:hypothetical protein [Gossypium lobatum]
MRSDSQSVPERYVHENNEDGSIVSQDSANSLQIPVIDFSFLAKGDKDEVHKLHLACEDWGFFQIINHGVKEEILKKMKAAVAAFFELPIEEKKKYGKAENEIEGYGQNFVVSQHQKLDWSDMIYLITLSSQNRIFKFWPLSLPGFKNVTIPCRSPKGLIIRVSVSFQVLYTCNISYVVLIFLWIVEKHWKNTREKCKR